DFRCLDILVHAAGVYRRAQMAESTIADLDDQYRTNVRAPYQLTQAMLPALFRQGSDVVFINSTRGLSAGAGLGQYSASQHAVKAVADSLRAEINTHCVRVTTVHLGRTATPLQESILAVEGRSYKPERLIQPEDVADVVVAVITLPRRAQVTSVTLWPTEKV
ncbi:MAG: SDR family NAD(P)-dependent oxidoreductase, partial [Pseudonocardiaceae bacterium]